MHMLHGKGAAKRNQLTKLWYLSFDKTIAAWNYSKLHLFH